MTPQRGCPFSRPAIASPGQQVVTIERAGRATPTWVQLPPTQLTFRIILIHSPIVNSRTALPFWLPLRSEIFWRRINPKARKARA